MRDGGHPKRSAWGPNGRAKHERDMVLLSMLQEEELEAFRRLEEQVVDERESGAARTRFSILRTIANMQDSQLIDLITLYEATVREAAAAAASTAASETVAAPATAAAPVAKPEEVRDGAGPATQAAEASPLPEATSSVAAPDDVVAPPGLADAAIPDPPTDPDDGPDRGVSVSGLDPDRGAPEGGSTDLDAPPGLGFSTGSASSGVLASSKLEDTISTTDAAAGAGSPVAKDLGDTATSASLEDGQQDATTPERSEGGGLDSNSSLPGVAGTKISIAQLESWYRRRAFELRVGLEMGPGSTDQVLEVLKNLQDEQLMPPFTEVKMWLGLDEQEPMPEKLQTLVTEFRNLRSGQEALPPMDEKMGPLSKEPQRGGKRPSGPSPKAAGYPATAKATKAPSAWPQAGS